MSLFEEIQRNIGTSIRRLVRVFVDVNEKGETVTTPIDGEETTLSTDGSPDTVTIQYASFWDCRHPMTFPLKGKCFFCNGTCCQLCFGSCLICQVPICLSCSPWKETGNSLRRLCKRCHDEVKRKKLFRALISPIVETNERE